MKKFGIGKKTMTGGILLIVIPILLIGIFCTLTVSNKLIEMSGQQLQALSQKLAELCDNILMEELKVAKTLASNEFMAMILEDDSNPEERKRGLEDIMGEMTVALGDHYEAVGVADKAGQMVAINHGGDVEGLNVSSRDYFQKAIKGEPNIGEFITSLTSKRPILPIVAPVVDRNGGIHGVLMMILKDNYLNDRVAQTKFGETGFAALVSHTGLILAHPKKEMVLKTDISGSEGTAMAQMWHHVKNLTPGVVQFNFQGVDRIGGIAPLTVKKWSIAANQDRSELLAPAFEIRDAIILVGGIFLVITIGLVVFYTRGLSIPLSLMAESARRLAQGDIEMAGTARKHAAKIQARKDEIGEMAAAFSSLRVYIQEKAELSVHIAEGDLNQLVKVSSDKDVLGHSFRKMTGNLKEIVGQVNEAALQIDTGTSQVSESSQVLSQGATEQASSLEEITSSVAQLASQTKINAENAFQANRLSNIAREKAENGNEQIREMTSAMSGISESSKEIAKIIKTIDEIAFQTNLLALNAAVEAARAGTHGKGFAVVAQEVRSLAGRSAKAAQETAQMIEGALRTIDGGSNIVEQTTGALVEIVEGATKAADLVSEIASASREQAEGIAQINQGLSQVETVTQQNTANAEETASASEELTHQAAMLRKLVTFFKLDRASRPEREGGRTVKTTAPKALPLENAMGVWGGDHSGKPNKTASEGIIPLDDDDFGKY